MEHALCWHEEEDAGVAPVFHTKLAAKVASALVRDIDLSVPHVAQAVQYLALPGPEGVKKFIASMACTSPDFKVLDSSTLRAGVVINLFAVLGQPSLNMSQSLSFHQLWLLQHCEPSGDTHGLAISQH